MLIFEEGEIGVPGEKLFREQRTRTNNKLNPHMMLSLGIEPGPLWREASALTTALFLLPALLFMQEWYESGVSAMMMSRILFYFSKSSYKN